MTEQRVVKDPRRLNREDWTQAVDETKTKLDREEERYWRYLGHLLPDEQVQELREEFNTNDRDEIKYRLQYKIQGHKNLLELLEDHRPRCPECGIGGPERASDA